MRRLFLGTLGLLAGCAVQQSSEAPLSDREQALDFASPPQVIGDPIAATMSTLQCQGCAITAAANAGAVGGGSLTNPQVGGGWSGGVLPPTWANAAAAANQQLASNQSTDVTGKLNVAKAAIDAFCGSGCTTTVTQSGPIPWTRAWPALFGRHLKTSKNLVSGALFAQTTEYGYPAELAELRARGARSYCGMRQAAAQVGAGGKELMHADPWASWLFWDFAVVGSRVKLDVPKKFVDQGSESFSTPIVEVSNLAPLRGPLAPELGDLSHEIAWVSADREVESKERWGRTTAFCLIGQPCPSDYLDRYRNLEHLDVFSGEKRQANLALQNVTVATWPPFVTLKAGGNIDVTVGELDTAHELASGSVNPSWSPRSTALDLGGAPSAWASDAPLWYRVNFMPMYGGVIPTSSPWAAPPSPATYTRWRQADDRAIVVTDRIATGVDLTASAGIDLGVVSVSLNATSKLTTKLEHRTIVREQLDLVAGGETRPAASSGAVPQTSIVVTPESTRDVSVDPLMMYLQFHAGFHIPWPIDEDISVDWQQNFLTMNPISLASSKTLGEEKQRLRVGEFSNVQLGNTDGGGEGPSLYSHVPGQTSGFASFPATAQAGLTGKTVAECLADPANPPAPTAPSTAVTVAKPAEGRTCVVGFGNLTTPKVFYPADPPANACGTAASRAAYAQSLSSFSAYGKSTPEMQACLSHAVDFVCRSTSQQQTWQSLTPTKHSVIAHVMPVDGTAPEWQEYQSILDECAQAIGKNAGTVDNAKTVVTGLMMNFLTVHACTADGKLQGDH